MTDIHTWVGAYVVDALEPEEQVVFEAHLSGCERCRREVTEFRETLTHVAAADATPPPPELRASVLSAISRVGMVPADEPSPTSVPETPSSDVDRRVIDIQRRRVPARVAWMVAAAALVASIVLGTGVVVLREQDHRRQLQVQANERDLTVLLAADDVRVHRSQLGDGAALSYVVSTRLGKGLLVAAELPSPPQGRVWQIWTMHDGTPESAGMISSGGRVQVWMQGLPGAQAIAITDEPAGGSKQPTTTPQALAEL